MGDGSGNDDRGQRGGDGVALPAPEGADDWDEGEEDPEAARLRAATGVFAAPFDDAVLSPRQREALAAASRTLLDTWLDGSVRTEFMTTASM